MAQQVLDKILCEMFSSGYTCETESKCVWCLKHLGVEPSFGASDQQHMLRVYFSKFFCL